MSFFFQKNDNLLIPTLSDEHDYIFFSDIKTHVFQIIYLQMIFVKRGDLFYTKDAVV